MIGSPWAILHPNGVYCLQVYHPHVGSNLPLLWSICGWNLWKVSPVSRWMIRPLKRSSRHDGSTDADNTSSLIQVQPMFLSKAWTSSIVRVSIQQKPVFIIILKDVLNNLHQTRSFTDIRQLLQSTQFVSHCWRTCHLLRCGQRETVQQFAACVPYLHQVNSITYYSWFKLPFCI